MAPALRWEILAARGTLLRLLLFPHFHSPLYLKSVTDQALYFDEKRRTRELVTDSLFTELALKEPALPC
jgi:uncharacterized protein (DUF952 family)